MNRPDTQWKYQDKEMVVTGKISAKLQEPTQR